jgi:hypothetical protein
VRNNNTPSRAKESDYKSLIRKHVILTLDDHRRLIGDVVRATSRSLDIVFLSGGSARIETNNITGVEVRGTSLFL